MQTSSASFNAVGTNISESFSQVEKESSFAAISPELFQAFTFFINQAAFGEIAWRKAAYEKKQESVKMLKEDGTNSVDNKHKLTGSPAFKELKNLIITILSNSRRTKLQ